MKASPHILLVRTDRLGEFLLTLPLIRRIRQNYPEARISVLCSEGNADLLKYHLDVNRVWTVKNFLPQNYRETAVLWSAIRKARPDMVVIPHPHKYYHLLAAFSGAGRRAGFDRKWGFLLNFRIRDEKAKGLKHEILLNQELLDGWCQIPWDKTLDLDLDTAPGASEIEARYGLLPGKKKIFFHCTSSNPAKEWPPERFRSVMEHFLKRPRYQVIWVGSGVSEETRKHFHFDPAAQFLDLTNRTPLIELGLLLRHAHCLISLDSGPYHLAWLQKVPVVGLFFAEAPGSNPIRWGVLPGFAPARQIHKPALAVTPEEVCAAAEELLTAA